MSMRLPGLVAWVTLALVAAAPRAGAQPFKWWQDEKSRAALGLTAEQVQKIEEIFTAATPSLRANYQELDKREKQLSSLIEKADTTETEVLRQLDQVEAVRSELNKERTLMLFRMYQVLTPEQRTKLSRLHDRRQPSRERPSGTARRRD